MSRTSLVLGRSGRLARVLVREARLLRWRPEHRGGA